MLGRWALDLPPGEYRFRAAAWYNGVPQVYPGIDGDDPHLDAGTTVTIADAPVENIDFAMKSPRVVTGRVLDGAGSPVANAEVTLLAYNDEAGRWEDELEWHDFTASDGTFVLPARTEREYQLAIEAIGAPVTYWGDAERPLSASSPRITVGLENVELGDLTVDVSDAVTISGRVTAPSPGAIQVEAVALDSRTAHEDPVTADPDGSWSMTVEPGEYRLYFYDPLGTVIPQAWDGRDRKSVV